MGAYFLRLSTRSRYGVAALYELATRSGGSPVNLRQIAEGQGLSERYLEQLFLTLRRAEIVSSIRGAQGGYVLARPAGEITVGDIVRALEGPIDLVSCVADEDGCTRDHVYECPTRPIWIRLAQCIGQVLDSISLADVADAGQHGFPVVPCEPCKGQGGSSQAHD